MPISSIIEYYQSLDTLLVVEYFYQGEKIEDPTLFFDLNPGLFELVFPSPEATQAAINQNLIFGSTHKLVISEYGFNLVFL